MGGIVVGISENYLDNCGARVYRYYNVEKAHYPCWFLGFRYYGAPLYGGAYVPMRPDFAEQGYQDLYVYESYNGLATLYVHTPELDAPGVYAVYDSTTYTRDGLWQSSGEDLRYRGCEFNEGWELERQRVRWGRL